MKIAILGSFDFHLECLGFLLEIYNHGENKIDVYLKNNSDKLGWINHYIDLYNFSIFYDKFSDEIIKTYDKIFKLTSHDPCLDHSKIVSILHLDGIDQRKCKSDKLLSLTPYIKGENIINVFPIYRPLLNISHYTNTIIMIGAGHGSIDNDAINFININSNYYFIFINADDIRINNINNVKLLPCINTDNLINLVNNCKYILSKKRHWYDDRFCGQLSMAMSFEKPLIIDLKTKKKYNLPGLVFGENYSEIGNLDEISDEKYNNLKAEVKLEKEKILLANKERFNKEF